MDTDDYDGGDDDDDDDDKHHASPNPSHLWRHPPPSRFDLVLQVKTHVPLKNYSQFNCFMLNKTLLLHLYISALMWDCGSKSLLNIFY